MISETKNIPLSSSERISNELLTEMIRDRPAFISGLLSKIHNPFSRNEVSLTEVLRENISDTRRRNPGFELSFDFSNDNGQIVK